VEMEIPLSAIGLRGASGERIDVRVRRCDAPEEASKRCGEVRPITLVLD
jgi:hypothetical protein